MHLEYLKSNSQFISIINNYKDPAPLTYLTESTLSTLTTVSLTSQLVVADNFAKNFRNISTINILDEITSLGEYAFSATAITSFTMPKNITVLPDYCLYSCSKLTTLILNDVCYSIGNYALSNCVLLEEIVWNEALLSLNEQSFSYCRSLKKLILPKNTTHLGSEVFRNCTGLEIVYLGEKVSTITNGVSSTVADGFIAPFKNCNPDKLIIYIYADDLYKFGYWWDNANMSSSGSIEVIEGCKISEDGKYILQAYSDDETYNTLVRYLGDESSVIISSEIEYIKGNAFINKNSLLTEVIINHKVIIQENAFNNCFHLRKVYICASALVYDRAFINCTNATIVTAKEEGSLAHLIRYDNGSTIQYFSNIVYNTSYEDYLAM